MLTGVYNWDGASKYLTHTIGIKWKNAAPSVTVAVVQKNNKKNLMFVEPLLQFVADTWFYTPLWYCQSAKYLNKISISCFNSAQFDKRNQLQYNKITSLQQITMLKIRSDTHCWELKDCKAENEFKNNAWRDEVDGIFHGPSGTQRKSHSHMWMEAAV